MNTSEQRRFQPGDIVRVVRGKSKKWMLGNKPLRVIEPQDTPSWHMWIETLDGSVAVNGGSEPWVLQEDCELDVFLTAATKAVRDA